MQSEHIHELVVALSQAQGELSPAEKSGKNPHFKSKYAGLTDIWAACRQVLPKNGLAVIQTMEEVEGRLRLVTTLAHKSGQWIKSSLPIITTKNDAQGIGSAITYMRRYALSAIVGVVADDDDDAEHAMGRNRPNCSKPYPHPMYSQPDEPQIAMTITADQAMELGGLLAECPPEYVDTLSSSLLKQFGVQEINKLPISLYDRIKAALIKNKREVAHA